MALYAAVRRVKAVLLRSGMSRFGEVGLVRAGLGKAVVVSLGSVRQGIVWCCSVSCGKAVAVVFGRSGFVWVLFGPFEYVVVRQLG